MNRPPRSGVIPIPFTKLRRTRKIRDSCVRAHKTVIAEHCTASEKRQLSHLLVSIFQEKPVRLVQDGDCRCRRSMNVGEL